MFELLGQALAQLINTCNIKQLLPSIFSFPCSHLNVHIQIQLGARENLWITNPFAIFGIWGLSWQTIKETIFNSYWCQTSAPLPSLCLTSPFSALLLGLYSILLFLCSPISLWELAWNIQFQLGLHSWTGHLWTSVTSFLLLIHGSIKSLKWIYQSPSDHLII